MPPFFDLGRESSHQQILSLLRSTLAAVQLLNRKVDTLMSEDATVAAEVTEIEADQAAIKTALESTQALVVALQAEVAGGNLSQATLDALTQAQSDLDALNAEAQADVATDTPAPPAP